MGKKRYPYQTADPAMYGLLKAYAAKNKAFPTEAESLIWNYLKASQLGVRYRPQHIIGCYIADFLCESLKLIIEVDGPYHAIPEQMVSDEERVAWLERQGYKVLRFSNEEIFYEIEKVIEKIKKEQNVRYKYFNGQG